MSNERDLMRSQLGRTVAGVTVGLIFVLLVYVFSTGPAWWLVSKGVLSWPTFRAVYKPIAFLEDYGTFKNYIFWQH